MGNIKPQNTIRELNNRVTKQTVQQLPQTQQQGLLQNLFKNNSNNTQQVEPQVNDIKVTMGQKLLIKFLCSV